LKGSCDPTDAAVRRIEGDLKDTHAVCAIARLCDGLVFGGAV
jgi:hypothetical protein